MKRIPFFLVTVLIICQSFYSLSQVEPMVLMPELNKQYIYGIIYKEYVPGERGQTYTDEIRRKKLKIQYQAVPSSSQNLLFVTVVENNVLKPELNPVQYADYLYPQLREGFTEYRQENFFQELLSTVVFQYVPDKEKNEVKLQNRPEVLLQVRETLIKKGFDKKITDRHLESFNSKGIPEISRYLNKIYFPSDAALKEMGAQVASFNRQTSHQDSLKTITYRKNEESPGLIHYEYTWNPQWQFLSECKRIEIDTLQWPALVFNRKIKQFFAEETIQLVSQGHIPENKLTISGVIENVRNRKVTVGVLRDPFGTELHLETALLDKNNAFEIETGFAHAGMVHLQFGQAPDARNLPVLMFYAEPGSRIHVKIDGRSYPGLVEFSGDFSREAHAIHQFRSDYGLSFSSFNFNSLFTFYEPSKYVDFHNALSNLMSFTEKIKGEINAHTYKFITGEINAQLLSMGLYYLKYMEYRLIEAFNNPADSMMSKIDTEFIKSEISKYNLYNSYNNYGIHSRMLAGQLLEYYYTTSRKVSGLRGYNSFGYDFVFSEFRYLRELPHQVEVAKTILAGHPLYSQLAGLIQQEKMNISDLAPDRGNYRNNDIEKYLELMMRLVNDPEFTGSIGRMMNNYQIWLKEDYVPEVEFLNQKGEKLQLKDFFGQKPTVFYVSRDWSVERYFLDDLARENPNMNFVMVMEGSNFAEWTDYLSRAEPVAHQLFLDTENYRLHDVFKTNSRHFIVYDKSGNRIGFAQNPVNAVNLVKQSLIDEKKEPDKSQLMLIIVLLSGLFICSLLVLVLWKWRVRLQFRKEQQHRRLRELELTAIRSQMNPHFLFNCLNSVQNLVQQNRSREAHLYLADFAGLIRKVLNNSEKEEVSLAEELDMVQQYLNLEKLRFDFDYQVNINNDVDIYNTSVPSMLLQPFAENAVTHGLQNKPGNRQLKIEVKKKFEPSTEKYAFNGILISIEDNGIGREAAQKTETLKNGKGTRLMQERLAILQQKNKEKYWLQTTDLYGIDATGTKVEIYVPEEI